MKSFRVNRQLCQPRLRRFQAECASSLWALIKFPVSERRHNDTDVFSINWTAHLDVAEIYSQSRSEREILSRPIAIPFVGAASGYPIVW